jgi:hypothetical protein
MRRSCGDVSNYIYLYRRHSRIGIHVPIQAILCSEDSGNISIRFAKADSSVVRDKFSWIETCPTENLFQDPGVSSLALCSFDLRSHNATANYTT